MEAKHTPGPWKAIVDPEGWELVASGRGQTIATFDCSESDARLIAAAPDLLAALEKAADWIDAQLITANDITDYDNEVFRDALKAIAKAKGD